MTTHTFRSSYVDLPVSLIVAWLCVVSFSDQTILFFIIIFGQVHFLLSYFYSHKIGKIDALYAKKFFLALVLVGTTCFFIFSKQQFIYFLIFFTALFFVIHYFNDECRLSFGGGVRNQLFGIGAVACSFFAVFAVELFSLRPSLVVLLAVVATGLAVVFVAQRFLKTLPEERNPVFLLFFFFNIVVPFFFAFHPEAASINQVLGFIIIFHYVRWYLYYFQKFRGEELDSYTSLVAWTHIFVFLLFVEYRLSPLSGTLYIFFDPIFFYGWTILHIFLTLRPKDYSIQL